MDWNKIKKELQEPFQASEIEWRVQQAGTYGKGNIYCMVLAYVQSRAIQNRLDDVFGINGWKSSYKVEDVQISKDESLLFECTISVYDPDKKEWINKSDAAPQTQIESIKGGYSDAMKRAGVQWGIGRYLYNLDATFAQTTTLKPSGKEEWRQAKLKDGTKYFWCIPTLPAWALPGVKNGK